MFIPLSAHYYFSTYIYIYISLGNAFYIINRKLYLVPEIYLRQYSAACPTFTSMMWLVNLTDRAIFCRFPARKTLYKCEESSKHRTGSWLAAGVCSGGGRGVCCGEGCSRGVFVCLCAHRKWVLLKRAELRNRLPARKLYFSCLCVRVGTRTLKKGPKLSFTWLLWVATWSFSY